MTSFLFICHPSILFSVSSSLCALFLLLFLLFSIFDCFLFFLFFCLCVLFESDVFDDFVTNRWQNGEVVD